MVIGTQWRRVTLISHSGHKDVMNYSLYWNFRVEENSQVNGCYFFPGQSWGVLRGPDVNLDFSTTTFVIPRNPVLNDPGKTASSESSSDSSETYQDA